MRGTRWAAALTSLLLLLSCEGGAGGDGGTGALGIITLAADRTVEAGTARVSFEMAMEVGDEEVTTTGEGEFDLSGQRGHMTISSPAQGGGEIEVILDETTIYMKAPQLTDRLPGGEEWLAMDVEAMGDSIGIDLETLMQGGNNDPTQALNYLRGASGEVETIGEEEIRGVPTTHYRATVDLDKVIEQTPAEVRPAMKDAIKLLRSSVKVDEIPVEVWIDADGIARRYVQSIDAADGSSTTVTMEMYDFGAEVDVDPPPPSDVIDFNELMEQFRQGAPSP
jgi:hypothetical protein